MDPKQSPFWVFSFFQSDVAILGEDRIADIAVIKVDATCPLPSVRHTAPNVGDSVYILGFSSGIKLNFTKGMVTSMEQAAVFSTDAYADNGFSGGPVFNHGVGGHGNIMAKTPSYVSWP